jgi:hypothetical protein
MYVPFEDLPEDSRIWINQIESFRMPNSQK